MADLQKPAILSMFETHDEFDRIEDRDEENLPPAGQIGELLRERKFCEATRRYSMWSGTDCIESKLIIDRLAHKHGLAPRSGCVSYLMAIVMGAGGAIWWSIGQ